MKKKYSRLERKQLRAEENKSFILEAAETVFAQKGYGSATVDDIAEEAQFSKATLYRYFKSKRDIFIEIILNTFEEAAQKTKEIQQKKISVEDKLKELISHIFLLYQKKKNISRILFLERASVVKMLSMDANSTHSQLPFHPRLPKKMITKMREISNIIQEVIQEGIDSGEFRDIDVEDAGFIFGALLRGFYFRGPVHDRVFSLEESTELLYSFFLNGIKKEKT
jgi:AcrR family transcriptional regulator